MSATKIKVAGKLRLKKYRSEWKLFIAEGLRLCEMAFELATIEFGLYTKDFLRDDRTLKLVENLKKVAPMYEIADSVFEKISDTKTPQGIMAVVRQNLSTGEEVAKKSLIVALDGVHDPGNVGTILRTAEAFDCGVILLDEAADVFNSKVVRSSMGAIFNLPIVKMTRADFLTLMNDQNIDVTAAALDSAAEVYFNHDFKLKSAIVLGSEADGVSDDILSCAKKVFIPMNGKAESLNVAVAASIIISEAVRQRSK